MEDQGKRLLLAVGIIAVLFVVWTYLFPPKPSTPQPAPSPPTQPVAPTTAAAPAPTAAPAPGAPGAPATVPAAPPPASCTPETDGAPTWDTPDYTVTFSRCGGAVASFVLKGAQYREKRDGAEAQMDLVRARQNPAHFGLQTQVAAAPPGVTSPDAPRAPLVPSGAEWTLVGTPGETVTYQYATADGAQ